MFLRPDHANQIAHSPVCKALIVVCTFLRSDEKASAQTSYMPLFKEVKSICLGLEGWNVCLKIATVFSEFSIAKEAVLQL